MAVFRNGILLGRLGNTTTYIRNGKLVTRATGTKITTKPTVLQLVGRQKTNVISAFLSPIRDPVQIGFNLYAKKRRKTPHGQAFAYTYHHALKGTYPNIEIDFSKVMISIGNIPSASDAKVAVVEEGLKFTWDSKFIPIESNWDDQAMVVAYFTAIERAVYITSGANRNMGTELLRLYEIPHGQVAETYITFISGNRKRISDSYYTGSVFW